MTMPPVAEWAGHLQITEVMIECVVVDQREPAQPDRRKRDRAEAQQDARAPAGEMGMAAERLQFHSVDARVLPSRHEPGQVQWIGEKSEHASQREGNPLFADKGEP